MAKGQLIISDLGSLNFHDNWQKPSQWKRDYEQKFLSSDVITVQYAVSETDLTTFLRLKNIVTNEEIEVQPDFLAQEDGYFFRNAVITPLECGRYVAEFVIRGRVKKTSEFGVYSELPDTMLFEYYNHKDTETTLFRSPFQFRCEAEFFPQNEEYLMEQNGFRDYDYDRSLLSGEPYTTYGLSIGGIGGVPTWVGQKLNQIFALSEVFIGEANNRTEYVIADGESVKRVDASAKNPLYQFAVKLERPDDGVIQIPTDIITVDPSEITFIASGDSQELVINSINSIDSIVSNVDWLTIGTIEDIGDDNYTVRITAGANTIGSRDGLITITASGNSATVRVMQNAQTYLLQYILTGATPDTENEYYPYGTTVRLKTPEELGMILPSDETFSHWIRANVGDSPTEVVMTENIYMIGNYGEDTVTLTYTNPIILPVPIVETYPSRSTVVLKSPVQLGATIPRGYRFDGWRLDGASIITQPGAQIVNMREDIVATASISAVPATLTYNLPGAIPSTRVETYAFGQTAIIKTPEQLGMALSSGLEFLGSWIMGTRPYLPGDELQMTGNWELRGGTRTKQISLTYHISGATPEEIIETFDYGTTVQLKTPEQLGIVLPNGATWIGWIDGGEIITEITLLHDKIMEGEYEIESQPNVRPNQYHGTQAFTGDKSALELPRNQNATDIPQFDFVKRANTRTTASTALVQEFNFPQDIIIVPGKKYVLSFVAHLDTVAAQLFGTPFSFTRATSNIARFEKVTIGGTVYYERGQDDPTSTWSPSPIGMYNLLRTPQIVEILYTVRDNDTGSTITSLTFGHTGAGEESIRFPKHEDVTELPTEEQIGSPWIPHVSDPPYVFTQTMDMIPIGTNIRGWTFEVDAVSAPLDPNGDGQLTQIVLNDTPFDETGSNGIGMLSFQRLLVAMFYSPNNPGEILVYQNWNVENGHRFTIPDDQDYIVTHNDLPSGDETNWGFRYIKRVIV